MAPLKYLAGYPEHVLAQVREALAQGRVQRRLAERYGEAHAVRNDKALLQYTVALKDRYMRKAGPLHKVVYDDRLQVVRHALGTHTAVSRVQGGRLRASRASAQRRGQEHPRGHRPVSAGALRCRAGLPLLTAFSSTQTETGQQRAGTTSLFVVTT